MHPATVGCRTAGRNREEAPERFRCRPASHSSHPQFILFFAGVCWFVWQVWLVWSVLFSSPVADRIHSSATIDPGGCGNLLQPAPQNATSICNSRGIFLCLPGRSGSPIDRKNSEFSHGPVAGFGIANATETPCNYESVNVLDCWEFRFPQQSEPILLRPKIEVSDIMKSRFSGYTSTLFAALALSGGLPLVAVSSGCDNKEEVGEIETPDGEIEIERNTDTGALDVEVDD